MIALIQNEWMKARKKHKAWIFLLIMGFLLLLGALLARIFSNRFGLGISGIEYTIYSASVYTTIVSFYSIVLGASSITSEYKDGTIKQLFIRTYSRTWIMFSKYIVINLLTITLYYSLIAINFVFGLFFFGYDNFSETVISNLTVGLYYYPNIMFYITLAFMIGALSKSAGLANGLTFLIKFMSGPITLLVAMYDWGKYVIFPNLSLTAYSDNPIIRGGIEPLMKDISLGFSLMIIFLYVVVFMVPAILVTEKRDIL